MDNENTQKLLTIKEYTKIMNAEIKKHKQFLKEMEDEYIDFHKIKQYFQLDVLPYVNYCEVNDYKSELSDEDIKKMINNQ